MMEVMYEIPSDESISSCVVTEAAIEGTAPPLLVRDEFRRMMIRDSA